MKKKILFTSILLLFISLLFINNNVFATTYDLSDYKNHLNSGNVWVIVYSRVNGNFYLVTGEKSTRPYFISTKLTDEDGTVYSNGYFITSGGTGSSYNNSLAGVYLFTFDFESNTFKGGTYYNWEGTTTNKVIGSCDIIASGSDIYNWENTPAFFTRTPLPLQVVIAPTTLAEELEMAQVKENFQTMIRGIIPYLIALVVGLVAFWKAWQLLLKELRKA